MNHSLILIGDIAIAYAIVINLLYIFFLLVSSLKIGGDAYRAISPLVRDKAAYVFPPITVVIPAFNEAPTVVQTLTNLLSLDYPGLDVILVNDGSEDETLQVVCEAFDLEYVPFTATDARLNLMRVPRGIYRGQQWPGLTVIDKYNSGKGDSINAGINLSTSPLVATIDADSLVDASAFFHVAQVFLENPDSVVAVGGYIRVGNGCTIRNGRIVSVGLPSSLLARCQLVEYSKAFIGGRTGWAAANALLIVSGAFGVFRRELLLAVGGFLTDSTGEDMEIITRIHRFLRESGVRYRIAFCPQAICWTQAPELWGDLAGQRRRWAKGNFANVLRFRALLFRIRYGVIGIISLPYVALVELMSPYITFVGIFAVVIAVIFGVVGASQLVWLFVANVTLDYVLGVGSLLLDDRSFQIFSPRDVAQLLVTALHIPFWYYYVNDYWRIKGHIEFFTNRHAWNTIVRKSWGQAP